MGAWGTKLYQNDIASDIKESYINKQRAGKTAEEALRELLEDPASARRHNYIGWWIIIYVKDLIEDEWVAKGVKDVLPLVYVKMSEKNGKYLRYK